MPAHDLDDPDYAAFAWGRFKRIMAWMVLVSLVSACVGLVILNAAFGAMPLLAMLFSGAGIFFTVLLAAVLMGLIFLSSGSGHDDKIEDPTRSGDE